MEAERSALVEPVEWFLDHLAVNKGASPHTITAYRNDLSVAKAFFQRNLVENWADLTTSLIARFESTLEAWPVIIATVEAGRSPRTLSLDWIGANGRGGSISAGPRLERWARRNNGEPHPYPSRAPRTTERRVAES